MLKGVRKVEPKAKPKFNIIVLIILKKIENYLYVLNNRKNG
jgi:hypothetical protein